MAGDSAQKAVIGRNHGESEYGKNTTTMGLLASACFARSGCGQSARPVP